MIADDMIAFEEPSAIEDDIAALSDFTVADNVAAVNESTVTDNIIAADEPAMTDNVITAYEPAVTDNVATVVNSPAETVPAEAWAENQPEPRIASGTLTMIPAEERIPIAPDQTAAASRTATPRGTVSPLTQPVETPAAPAEFSPFQAPLISGLEQGKWYVQIGVYSRPDNVEDEISRIGTAYPVAIQNIGSDTSPMFRVLLGPLNQGESGAMLQRFKSIGYADAFVRHN